MSPSMLGSIRTLLTLATLSIACLASTANAQGTRASGANTPKTAVWLHTRDVRDLLVHGDELWVASSGGVERYALESGTRRAHVSEHDGLAENDVLALKMINGSPAALGRGSICRWQTDRWSCAAAPSGDIEPGNPGTGTLEGVAITASVEHEGARFVGTRGAGLWRLQGEQQRRLTPEGQVCTQQVHSMVEHRGELWVAGFRDGLCHYDGQGFVTVPAPFRMVNAMLSARGELYVASGQGLFVLRDSSAGGVGSVFEHIEGLEQRAVTGLARRGRFLWATTSSALWRVPLGSRGTLGSYWLPGGSKALQGITTRGRELWLASEDRGLIRYVDGEFEVFDRLRGLPSSWMLGVTSDDQGRIYGASLRDGLVVLSPTGSGREMRVSQAMKSEWLMRVTGTERGVWIGTQAGVRRWPSVRSDATQTADTAAVTATELDAAGVRASVHFILERPDGLWIGSEAGLYQLLPDIGC